MLVKELRAALKGLPSNKTIIMASDEEGNNFNNIHEVAIDELGNPIIWPSGYIQEDEDYNYS
ncbi:hypothetical protein M0R04_06575 [Candidatus Dojkabacteria bacterium]|jgi:hypothetical protein|nr:hypothetical protein [Candidatus Dojkabacteria bacterium]